MTRTGFYPGSFDPVTIGHIDIIERAALLVDRLVIGVGLHHGKRPLFDEMERMELLKPEAERISGERGVAIEVKPFDRLTVDAAREFGANVLIRGLRDAGDFDYEMQMSGMNGAMAPDVSTIFLAASPAARHIASTFVRQIAAMRGDITPFVPAHVAEKLRAKFA